MNHSRITDSHAAFFGRWMLICIGACFLAAQTLVKAEAPLFIPQAVPLNMILWLLAGTFFLISTLVDAPMHTMLGCLALPLCVFITGMIGLSTLNGIPIFEMGSSWRANLLIALLLGAFFGLCQVITMPPRPRLALLWPLCTAASAAIGLGAIYLLAPTTMIMGPRLGASNTRWYDFAALATAFGAIFGLTSGIALTWLYRELIGEKWYSSPVFHISELCICLIIGFFACSWSTTTNQSIFPKTRPDTFSVEYRTSNRSYGRHILLSAEECSYTAGSDYAYNESDRLIDTRCSLSSEDLDHLFAAMKSVNIDRIPYLDKFAFLTFDQAWEYLTFTIDGASYELSFNSDLEDLTPEQQQRWLYVLDTIDEICQKNLPQVVVKRTPGP